MVSIVAPAYNEAKNLAAFVAAMTPVLESLGEPWEIVFVDDGSRDDTLGLLLAARAADSRLKIVGLARNFGKDVALSRLEQNQSSPGVPAIRLKPLYKLARAAAAVT